MLANIFPRTLAGLIRRTVPRHRVAATMLPLVPEKGCAPPSVFPGFELLQNHELQRAASFGAAKRRRQWLTGRLCAKLAARIFLPTPQAGDIDWQPQRITVVNAPSGRPFFTGELPTALQAADLSLSHSDDLALALVADTGCGIDIQHHRNALLRVREKFCRQSEEDILDDVFAEIHEIKRLTLLWSAKEAAKKALGRERMPGFLELLLTGCAPHADGWLLTLLVSAREFDRYPATITIVCELYEEYAIAVCLAGEAPRA